MGAQEQMESVAVDKDSRQLIEAPSGNNFDISDPSVMEADAVVAALEVDVHNGLSAEEAARRLVQNGPDELRAAPRVPAWRRALAQFQDPLIRSEERRVGKEC